MFCPNCGANIPVGLHVCPECGTEISVSHNHGGSEYTPFIVAEDTRDTHTPFGPVREVPEGGGDVSQPVIIEAEEGELPDESPDCQIASTRSDMADRTLSDEDTLSDKWEECLSKESDMESVLSEDEILSVTGNDRIRSSVASPSDTVPSPGQSSAPIATITPETSKNKSCPSASFSYTESKPTSRRRSMTAGLAVMIFVVLGLAILIYGLPGQGSGDLLVSAPTHFPTVLPDETPVPTTEMVPIFAPSENLILSVSAYGGGYKVEIDGGLMANEVATIVVDVEDRGGIHTVEWVYPSRHESYFLAREAYNGTPSAIEHVVATATYTDGKKEVVFSGNL